MALPEQALDGRALPQLVVEGRAPRWHVMCRISLGRRPSERRWIRERMSVRRRDVMVASYDGTIVARCSCQHGHDHDVWCVAYV